MSDLPLRNWVFIVQTGKASLPVYFFIDSISSFLISGLFVINMVRELFKAHTHSLKSLNVKSNISNNNALRMLYAKTWAWVFREETGIEKSMFLIA